MYTILFALASIGIALGLYYVAPETTERWFWRIVRAKRVVFAVFAVLVAFVLLGTGSVPLMLSGAVILGLLALTIVVDDPLEVA